nr:hypothetical protein Itr_chr07CG04810 [Ipomoea trifida]
METAGGNNKTKTRFPPTRGQVKKKILKAVGRSLRSALSTVAGIFKTRRGSNEESQGSVSVAGAENLST